IVVTVDEHSRRPGRRLAPFADDDGMALRRVDRGIDADRPKRTGDPIGRARGVGVVLRAGADARNAKEGEQLVAGLSAVAGEVRVEIGGERHSGKPARPAMDIQWRWAMDDGRWATDDDERLRTASLVPSPWSPIALRPSPIAHRPSSVVRR